MSIDQDQINIFQITDTHLFRDDNTLMHGVNTHKNFYAVIEKSMGFKSYTLCEKDYACDVKSWGFD